MIMPAAPAETLVDARDLAKAYGSGAKRTQVLDGVSLTLRRGEVLTLLGPNGAGKTTMVRILSTLLKPDRGSAIVAGHDVVRDAARVREVISLTGQYAAVDDKQTGRENLAMMGRLARLPRPALRRRVDELLDAFGLADAAQRRVGTYSGGMRRRLDLAAGLLGRPQIMFLDEPTTGLDPRSRQNMWEVIRQVIAGGTSIFLTTQYLEEADQLADRIALIDGGQVVAEGTSRELKQRIGDAGIELTLPNAEEAMHVAQALGVLAEGPRVRVPTDGSVPHVRSVLVNVEATGRVPVDWQVRAPSLDDVFLTLTGQSTHTPAAPANSATATTSAATAAGANTDHPKEAV